MSNKKHNIEEIKTVASTPVTPNLGYSKVYPKSDGEWYRLNDAGNEAPLGGSGGGGTVTSIGLALDTVGTDISISDSPITTSGDITLNIPDASSSARGALTSSDWSVFNNKIDGSGTLNFLTKWDSSGDLIDSQIKDDGASIGINAIPTSSATVSITSNTTAGLYVASNTAPSNGSSIKTGISINVSGSLSDNRGIDLSVSSGTTTNTGIIASATGTIGTTTWGAIFSAQGAGTKYSVRLADGTNATNKFLKSVTASGDANWANIQVSEVNGAVGQISGTENYITKFTSSSSVITVSQIYDNGTCLAIGYGPTVVSSHKFSVTGENSNTSVGGYFINDNVLADPTGYGLVGASIKATGTNIGVAGRSIGTNTGTNIGISGTANNGSTANIGGHFIATGSNSRAVKLEDSTAASYRVLRCLDSNGNAEWTQNLYSFEARSINMNALPSGLTASTAPSTGPYLGTGATDPNARQVILTGLDDNGLGSAYSTSTGEFTVSEDGWYQVGLLISLSAQDGAWSPGTFIIGCVERNTNNGSTILLATSTVDAYGPPQIVLNATRLVKLFAGYVLRVSVLLKGTENYTPIITDTIKFSVVRTA